MPPTLLCSFTKHADQSSSSLWRCLLRIPQIHVVSLSLYATSSQGKELYPLPHFLHSEWVSRPPHRRVPSPSLHRCCLPLSWKDPSFTLGLWFIWSSGSGCEFFTTAWNRYMDSVYACFRWMFRGPSTDPEGSFSSDSTSCPCSRTGNGQNSVGTKT